MKTTEITRPVDEFTCYLLIFLFTYTGVSKFLDRNSFEAVLLQSPIIRNYALVISYALPVIEILISVLLLLEKYRYRGFILSLMALSIFTSYIGYLILFVPNLPCSCGGVLKELSWRNHIIFNLFFIILNLVSLHQLSVNKFFIAINRKSRKPV